jgi:ABC-type multidrug transport system ATPase subunit
LGTNGAGKSTTFKMMTGEITPTNGTIHIDGKSIPRNI